MTGLVAILVSYVIGLLPSAYIAGHLVKGVDIRTVGDRNPGAANVYRNVSHLAGILVLVADVGKGTLAILIAQTITSQPTVSLCGLAVVAGHDWPIFFGFKGGRGLATTIGVLLAMLPIPMAITLAACAIPFLKTRNLVVTGVILFAPLPVLAWRTGSSLGLVVYSVALPCLAGILHLITTRNLPEQQKREALYMR